MFDVVNFRVRHVLLTAGLAAALMSNASAASNTLTVRDPRPVAKAVEERGNRYGWQITYEDLPYAQLSGMPDVTPLVQENAAPVAGASRTLASKGSLLFALPSAGQTQSSVIEKLVKTYNASSGGNAFAIVQGVRLLHVVPQKVTGLSGNEAVKPILDTVITVEPKARNALELLEDVCKKISANANTNVVVGTVPINRFVQTKTSIGGSGRTARSILEQLILESGAPLSWQLFYDPEYRSYALNIDWLVPAKKQ
jgi:hypothetical protein